MTNEILDEPTTPEVLLDTEWIRVFEQTDDIYSLFYKDDNEVVSVNYVFVNKHGEIERVKNEQVLLPEKNKIPADTLVNMIATNKPKKFSFYFMLKYNITIEPDDVKYLASRSYDYLTQIKKVQDICFERTITMFQDLNELTIFFVENTPNRAKTSKIRLYNKYKRHTMTMKHK